MLLFGQCTGETSHHGFVWSMLEISLSLIYQGPWSVLDLLDIFMTIGFNVKGCDLTGFPHFFYTHFQHENKHVNQFIVEFESCDLSVLVSTEITRLTLEENTWYFDITDKQYVVRLILMRLSLKT